MYTIIIIIVMCDVERRERLETVGTGRTKSDTSGM
jgi:hypothetical protein